MSVFVRVVLLLSVSCVSVLFRVRVLSVVAVCIRVRIGVRIVCLFGCDRSCFAFGVVSCVGTASGPFPCRCRCVSVSAVVSCVVSVSVVVSVCVFSDVRIGVGVGVGVVVRIGVRVRRRCGGVRIGVGVVSVWSSVSVVSCRGGRVSVGRIGGRGRRRLVVVGGRGRGVGVCVCRCRVYPCRCVVVSCRVRVRVRICKTGISVRSVVSRVTVGVSQSVPKASRVVVFRRHSRCQCRQSLSVVPSQTSAVRIYIEV